jgi:hypothetical protein
LWVIGGVGGKRIKHFDNTKVEYIFILCESNDMYLIPANDMNNVNCINLGKLYTKYKVD